MLRILYLIVLAYTFTACGGNTTTVENNGHGGHDHSHEGHDHDPEDHDHEHTANTEEGDGIHYA